jgi:hypothetical protein
MPIQGNIRFLLVPLDDLLVGILVAAVAGEPIGVDDAAERIATLLPESIPDRKFESTSARTHQIRAVRIKLSTRIIFLDVNQSLVDEPYDLEVVGCLHKLDTSKSVGRYDAGSAAWLRAPGDLFSFCIGDG